MSISEIEICAQLKRCILDGLRCSFSELLPDETDLKTTSDVEIISSLVSTLTSKRAIKSKRITYNELEALHYAVNFLALSSAYNTLQAKSNFDTLLSEMCEKDNHAITQMHFSKYCAMTDLVTQLATEIWNCYTTYICEAFADKDTRDIIFLRCLNDIAILSFNIMYNNYLCLIQKD